MDRLKPKSSLKKLTTILLIPCVVVVLGDAFGLPHVRWSYTMTVHDSTVLRAEYWSVTGVRIFEGRMSKSRVPLVRFLKPDPPMHMRIMRWAGLGMGLGVGLGVRP
ncbi:MAG: hypothetical protein ACIAS6_01100 [Phycisphaerales bacterium JB060]